MTHPTTPVVPGIPGSTLKIGTIAAGLYLVVLPFNGLAAAKNLCLAIAFVCALLLWFRSSEKRIPLVSMFLVWLTVATASLLWSHDVAASLSAIWRDVVKTSLVFFAFFVLADRQASAAIIMRIGTTGALAFASLAIYDFSFHGQWDNLLTPARYDVGVDALNWLVFVGTAVLAAKSVRMPTVSLPVGLLVLGLLLVAGAMTQSRSFNLTIVLGLALIAAMNYRHILQHKMVLAITAGAIAVTVIASIALLDRPLTYHQDRQILYSTVWNKVSSNLWQGTGFGHETDRAWYAPAFRDLPGGTHIATATHPHNIVLGYMDQMGVWGLLVLAYMFWSMVRELWRPMISGSARQKMLGQAGMLLVAVTLISNTFNFYFARQHLWMFFGMLGLLLGWIRADRRASQ